ncbi:hypothetical protein BASA61_007938 [Batrachochytrium salamandrivorans]|nr:hypothetical protein BASA61_007938 [Batrachochytrium salamandrivorans]
MMNPEIPTKSIYEWIPPNERAPAPTSDEDPVEIGLSYLVQKLNLQFNEFKMSTSFTDQLGVTHVCGTPFYKGSVNKNLHAAVHVKDGQAFFYSTIINEDQVLATIPPPTPESMVEKSSEGAHHLVFTIILTAIFPIYATVSHLTVVTLGGGVSRKRFKMGFTYKVVNLPKEDINDGFSTIVNPENFQSSPEGWTEGYKTIGNNVEANAEGGTPFETAILGVFEGFLIPHHHPRLLDTL